MILEVTPPISGVALHRTVVYEGFGSVCVWGGYYKEDTYELYITYRNMKINSKMYINFHIIPLSQNVRNTVILILYQNIIKSVVIWKISSI